jgi:O-antigen/teichoic acid export membrane protein
MVYGNLVANAVVAPFAYFRIRKCIKLQFDFQILKSTLHFSFPLLLMAIFAWALNMSDRLFLANFSTLESLGLYSMGSKIVSIMILLDGAIFQAYAPFFFNIANTEAEATAKVKLKSSNDAITLVVGVIAFGIVLLSNLLFYTIFNPEYRGSLIYVYILVLGAVLAQQTGLMNPMIYQNKKTIEISIITITCACISVGLNRLLIPLYGPVMAACTNLIASGCMFGMTLILARKNYYIPINFQLVLGTMALIVACYGLDISTTNVFVAFGIKLLLFAAVALIVLKCKIIDIEAVKPVVERLAAPLLGKFKRK